ncbi:MAG: histidine phosphatase family protein [Rhodobacteraceae bacterium]|nr:histidine phosphatase family protein [Paracoccaceae bacterium]
MTRTLILMRHAKSSWDTPVTGDHARPLNDRGRRSAAALGEWMLLQGWMPDQVLSSSSARTRETFARLGFIIAGNFTDDLYHAGPDQMLKTLLRASGETVLLLGHNPGIAEFAGQLVGIEPDHPRFSDYPTGATLVVEFDIDRWDHLKPGTGTVLDFTVPRDLKTS